MVLLMSSRRSPAPSPEGEAVALRPRTAPPSQPSGPASQSKSGIARAVSRVREEDVSKREEATSPPAAATSSDLSTLLRHSVVRDLIRESEGMLMELAVLRSVHSKQHTTERQLLLAREQIARGVLTTAEAAARAACITASLHRLVHRVASIEHLLEEEKAEKEELRNFAELAQAQLDSSLHPRSERVAMGSQGSPSPQVQTRRDAGGSGVTEGSEDSRRTSLQEITNLRGSFKRLRSVESSESGTPHDQRHRLSATQRSPDALTKVRKTMH